MDSVLKAILAEYAASSATKSAVPGGLWLSGAPQDASGTYGVLVPLSAVADHVMGSGRDHPVTFDVNIQISVCGEKAADAAAGKEAMVNLLEDNLLTLDGYRTLYARRSGEGILMRDPDTGWYWQVFEYRYIVGNSPT